MTADVINRPRVVAHSRPLARRQCLPEIPAWVPTAVADCARSLRPQKILIKKRLLTVPPLTDPSRTILTRLLTDPRMRSVWAELTRKERRTGRFLHPSRLERFAEASERQDRAMGALIFSVLWPYGHGWRPTARLRRDVDKDRAEAREMARKLRELAAREGAVERPYTLVRAKKLEDAAEALDDIARDRFDVVDRDRGSLEARGLAKWIAGRCEMLFGSPLPSVIATMTSVALDCEVSAQQVRDWRKEDKRQE
jgi:hypothetical protein